MTNFGPPRRPQEQSNAIGDKGELWLASQLPQGWIWQPPRKDLGKDGLVVVRDGSVLHNLEFSVQVKATLKPHRNSEAITIRNVSRSSVMYWMASTHPTLIIAVDLSSNRAWYIWHFDVFRSVSEVPSTTDAKITIRVPIKNELNNAAWDDIRSELRRCYNLIQNLMSNAHSYVWIVASTSSIAIATQNLLKISDIPIPDPKNLNDDFIPLLIEQQQHRNMLAVANKLLRGLDQTSKLYQDVHTWIKQYEELARSAFVTLGEVPANISNDFNSDLGFRPKVLASSRKQMVFLLLDLVTLITQVHPSGSHNAA